MDVVSLEMWVKVWSGTVSVVRRCGTSLQHSLAGVPEMYAVIWSLSNMMRAFGSGGRFGLIIACPTSVLPLLEVIAATMGYDLAVVVEGL